MHCCCKVLWEKYCWADLHNFHTVFYQQLFACKNYSLSNLCITVSLIKSLYLKQYLTKSSCPSYHKYLTPSFGGGCVGYYSKYL